MSRQEIQIVDLEPSVIGEDVTRYAIQVRGVDSNGNEGPWSSILEYESPELLPSLESNNYIEGVSGWRLDNDGTFEVNDGLIRGTLQSANYVPNTSGWALDVNGNVEFSTGTFRGALKIGQNTFNVDSGGNLFIGGPTFATSPFAVNTNGQIAAMSINGSFIQANTIAADRIVANSIGANQIAANSIGANQIRSDYVYAGQIFTNQVSSAQGPFSEVLIPNISAAKITTGTLDANNVTISGTLSAVTLNGVGGTFSGSLTAPIVGAEALLLVPFGFVSVRSLSGTTLGDGFVWVQERDESSRIGIGNNSGNPEARIDLRDIPLDDIPSGRLKGMRLTSRNSRVQVDGSFYLRLATTSTSTVANTRFNTVTGRIERMTNVSSIRYKQDIYDAPDLYSILDLKPRLFKYREQVEEFGSLARTHYGLIAEELSNLGLDYLIDFGDEKDGLPEAINYDKISVALIPIVKQLKERIQELERNLNGS